MATAADLLADPELLASAWDLSPDRRRRGRGRRRASARRIARAERTRSRSAHAGKVAELDARGPARRDARARRDHRLVGRAGSYATLEFTTDTADPARGALLQNMQERGTELETRLLFFELEWAALDDAQAERCSPVDRPRVLRRTTCAARAATGRIC